LARNFPEKDGKKDIAHLLYSDALPKKEIAGSISIYSHQNRLKKIVVHPRQNGQKIPTKL